MLRPVVTKSALLLIAGSVWICIGAMLVLIALSWLSKPPAVNLFVFAGAGVALALVIHHFGFLKIANKNMIRILALDKKPGLWSFIPLRSYAIIAVMITMGALLRHSSIPKHFLAILYIGIGLGLMLSSVRYFRAFFRNAKRT